MLTIGHTGTGTCICEHVKVGFRNVVITNPECPVTGPSSDGHIRVMSFSPDGKRFVSGPWDSRIKIWDTDSGEEVSSFVEVRCGTGKLDAIEEPEGLKGFCCNPLHRA